MSHSFPSGLFSVLMFQRRKRHAVKSKGSGSGSGSGSSSSNMTTSTARTTGTSSSTTLGRSVGREGGGGSSKRGTVRYGKVRFTHSSESSGHVKTRREREGGEERVKLVSREILLWMGDLFPKPERPMNR